VRVDTDGAADEALASDRRHACPGVPMNDAFDWPPSARVPSPCVSVCRMSEDGAFCSGCLRSIEEIGAWSGASEGFKREVWRQLALRRARLGPADGDS